jgi:uncharacterized protein (DUF885 family)
MNLRLCLLVMLVCGPSLLAQSPPSTSDDPSAALHRFFADEWDYELEQSPTHASMLGDRRANDRWDDVSLEAIEKRFAHTEAALARLRGIPRARLSPADQLNYDLFERGAQREIEGARFRGYLLALTPREGLQFADDLADALRFETVKDYEDWIGRLRRFGDSADQIMALLKEGVRARIVQPKSSMERVPKQIEKQLVSVPAESPFFKVFTHFPAAIGETERARLRREAEDAIREVVVPAYRRFQTFFTDEYLPGCFDEVGAWQFPDGAAHYAYLARYYTTTALTPPEIHALGLSEVKRIRGEMEKAKDAAGFHGSLEEFFTFLRTDPKFFFTNPDDLLAAYRAQSRIIDPRLLRLFRTLPRLPYSIEPIPESAAPDTTTAYYRPPADDGSRAGTFFVNLYKPETRPKWEMMVLALHEAVPGHHHQIALAREQGALPEFRRHSELTAYVEGWGLYSESLGEELGLYDDPYAKFGQLTYEMWRAVRLVVDTGIHSLKWKREEALDFFRKNAPKTEQDIANEVDRYISWPGQALAYKIGELKLKDLRARAERELGAKFDVRAFHDFVLLDGALPLEILERRVNEWIKSQRQP